MFEHPATPASLGQDLREATAALKGARTLRGLYLQDKHLVGVPHPLHAEGSFLFVRDLGIAWKTAQPFESELVITPADILQREGGKVSMHLSATQQPAVKVVADIFTAVFALDFEKLAAGFDLYSLRTGKSWLMGLKPHGAASGALKEILVSGGNKVERVQVTDANGDATDIRLRATQVSASAPSADELARFKP